MAGIKIDHSLNPQQLKKLVDAMERLGKRVDLLSQQVEQLSDIVAVAADEARRKGGNDVGQPQEAPAGPVAAPSAAGDPQPA